MPTSAPAAPARTPARELRGRERGRVGGAHRIDAGARPASRSSSARARPSNAAAKPLNDARVDVVRHELEPSTPSREIELLLRRERGGRPAGARRSVAVPPASAIRSASEGRFSTTIIRWPTAIAARGRRRRTRATRRAASAAARRLAPRPPPAIRTARRRPRAPRAGARRAVRPATHRHRDQGIRDRGASAEPGRGRDHRRVVGAERRAARSAAPGSAARSSRVRRDPADDRDPPRPVCSAAARVRSTSARTIARW